MNSTLYFILKNGAPSRTRTYEMSRCKRGAIATRQPEHVKNGTPIRTLTENKTFVTLHDIQFHHGGILKFFYLSTWINNIQFNFLLLCISNCIPSSTPSFNFSFT